MGVADRGGSARPSAGAWARRARARLCPPYNGLIPAMRDQVVEKPAACLELGDGDELVGLVGLIDRAWPDHDARDAGAIEQARFRAVSDLAVVALPGEPLRQASHVGLRRQVETGEAGPE